MLLLTLIAALWTQEDPAVLYREGLYEEVDQGNLDKAMAIYERLLKSGADAGLKARALYRRGSCLEKSGKKKEAEQVYRDLQERFPEQAELVKLARGRLVTVTAAASGPAATLETEILQLILDLGAGNDPREKAVQRLTLIGDPAVPELKRALSHKDRRLAGGAARVLVALEQYENLYDLFMRSSDVGEHIAFGRMLKGSEPDRNRFCRDCDKVRSYDLGSILRGAESALKDPRVRRVIEDRLAAQKDLQMNGLPNSWWAVSDPEHLPAFVHRLAEDGGPLKFDKVTQVLLSRPDHSGKFDVRPELAAELREMSIREGSRNYMNWLQAVLPYIGPDVEVKEVVPAWLKAAAVNDATEAAWQVREVALNTGGPRPPGLAEFLIDVLVSPDYREEVKRSICDQAVEAFALTRPELTTKLAQFYVGHLRQRDKDTERQGIRNHLNESARDFLIRYLPADAEGWATVFEMDLQRDGNMWVTLGERIRKSDRLRGLYVQALLKALTDESPQPFRRAAREFADYSTSREQRELARILPKLPKDLVSKMTGTMAAGFKPLSVEERTAAIREIAPLFKSPEPALRQRLILEFRAFSDPSMDAVMKDALSDPELQIRILVYDYWGMRRTPEALPILIQALKEPDDTIKVGALHALGRTPSLDSVPAILELLKSPHDGVRGAAQTALKAIQQYYDEQEQWRKWYEETKKRVPKDK